MLLVQVSLLIGEINHIVAAGEFSREKLTATSRAVLDMLPAHTQQQLLLDRDPHGNVQVSVHACVKCMHACTCQVGAGLAGCVDLCVSSGVDLGCLCRWP